jgi:hypothetical protein
MKNTIKTSILLIFAIFNFHLVANDDFEQLAAKEMRTASQAKEEHKADKKSAISKSWNWIKTHKKEFTAAVIATTVIAGGIVFAYKNSNRGMRTHSGLNISREELRTILNQRAGGITCVRGHYSKPPTKAEVTALEMELENRLTSQGLNFIKADGYYNGGHIPNSYIILDIKESELISLAGRFAQASVIILKMVQLKWFL